MIVKFGGLFTTTVRRGIGQVGVRFFKLCQIRHLPRCSNWRPYAILWEMAGNDLAKGIGIHELQRIKYGKSQTLVVYMEGKVWESAPLLHARCLGALPGL